MLQQPKQGILDTALADHFLETLAASLPESHAILEMPTGSPLRIGAWHMTG